MSQACLHCADPIPAQSDGSADFCCKGCEGAYGLINGLGLKSYYDRRILDPDTRSLRPEEDGLSLDYKMHAQADAEGGYVLHLLVEGIHCAACVWLIETALARQAGVTQARVNMTTRRLVLKWQEDAVDPNRIIAVVTGLGYRLVPYDPALLQSESVRSEKELLRCLAVAGFATANVMLFSVSVWAGYTQGMQESTRDLMHWVSALIALPAVVYAGRPFYRSALTALRAGRTNMDVPITLAVVLAAGMSVVQVIHSEDHAYFDSSVTLLFFLLIGRYLDRRARGRARGAAEHLLGLKAIAITVVQDDNTKSLLPPEQVTTGMKILCAAGERIALDGQVLRGRSDVDTSLITGESVPEAVEEGRKVFAGTMNLSAPLTIEVTATGEKTLLAEIVRLMEEAEQGRAKYVALADRVARYYAPLVHSLALITFIVWQFMLAAPWQESLLNAIAVLIITCPCALALAVPVVQVVASSRLMRQGILVKSGTALERLAQVKTIVFDKTGTLTVGRPVLKNPEMLSEADVTLAASLALNSRHPLSKAIAAYRPAAVVAESVQEIAGRGLEATDGTRLGSRAWCGDQNAPASDGPELWLARPNQAPVCFQFEDQLRKDAGEEIAKLQAQGLHIVLLSGDREGPVRSLAEKLGIKDWYAECRPADKTQRLSHYEAPLMVGDGLNDAPALAAALVSVSPSSAIDVSQNTADAVFQGESLKPIAELLTVARKADYLVKENIASSFIYNIVTVPLAMAGFVTPLIASIAMSTSSLLVIANALRLTKRKKP